MFNRFQRFYTSIKVATDVVVLAIAFGLAYATRFQALVHEKSIPPWSDTLVSLALVLIIFPVTFNQARLYATNRVRSHIEEVFEIFKAMITGTLIIVALTYFVRERYSRLTLAIFVMYAFVLVSGTRLLFRQALNELRRRGYNLRSIILIGAGDLGQRVIDTIDKHRELGFRITGILTRHADKVGTTVRGIPVIGHVSDVEAVLDARRVDQVLIALPIEDAPLVKGLMDQLAQRTVDVKIVPDLYQYITLCGGLEEFGGLPIISLQGGPLHGWNLVAKRLFDILVSLCALVLTGPLLLAIALLVKVTSRGPVLFHQERMGMDGRTFKMLKFRTMYTGAEASGVQMASRDDPRRTFIGMLLRRTSLDELPQFFNVLRGEMSLVGPRPERPVFIEEFKRQVPKYHLRHKVKAGMTGWAQINGLRGQTSIQKRIEYDLYYIENWSLVLDLKILVRTALGGFISKNAY
ncbi:MAG TPA: undecaprenyl-phosphate glucose phosphotransferase [Myxococcaceae bacterium]|nr:undecaprenyl-phosphate glucose phosphotransferase [Myxococcaceae bacterium]